MTAIGRSACQSSPCGSLSSSTRMVMRMANTPSENASSRPLLIARSFRDRQLQDGAALLAAGEAGEEIEQRHLPAVFFSQCSMGALLLRRILDDHAGAVVELALDRAARVARGGARLGVALEPLHLERRAVGEDHQLAVERRGPHGRLHAVAVLLERLEADVALVIERSRGLVGHGARLPLSARALQARERVDERLVRIERAARDV